MIEQLKKALTTGIGLALNTWAEVEAGLMRTCSAVSITAPMVHMNHVLKMAIKSLTGVTPAEALAATMFESSAQLRERVRRTARRRLGDGAPLIKLQAMLAECKRLTEKRNDLVHGLWAQAIDGEAHVRDALGGTRPLPTVDELQELARELEQHTGRLNFERLEGFLLESLQTSPSPTRAA